MSNETNLTVLCKLCGKPMPKGEEMLSYHGFSGPCPNESTASTSLDGVSEIELTRWRERATVPVLLDGQKTWSGMKPEDCVRLIDAYRHLDAADAAEREKAELYRMASDGFASRLATVTDKLTTERAAHERTRASLEQYMRAFIVRGDEVNNLRARVAELERNNL